MKLATLADARTSRAWRALEGATERCDAGRVAAYLDDLETDMAAYTEEFKAVRIPLVLMERAERLIPHLRRDPDMGGVVRASASAVVRLALLQGLDALERKWGVSEEPGS